MRSTTATAAAAAATRAVPTLAKSADHALAIVASRSPPFPLMATPLSAQHLHGSAQRLFASAQTAGISRLHRRHRQGRLHRRLRDLLRLLPRRDRPLRPHHLLLHTMGAVLQTRPLRFQHKLISQRSPWSVTLVEATTTAPSLGQMRSASAITTLLLLALSISGRYKLAATDQRK